MNVYIHNNSPLAHRVLVSIDAENVVACPIKEALSEAVDIAVAIAKGEIEGPSTPLALYGSDVRALGTFVDGDVDLACKVLLVTYLGASYCIICGPEMRKLSQVEKHLKETIGTTAVEIMPVEDRYVGFAIRDHYELARAASRITVVMDDGVVTHVEAVGVPRHVRVKIYNVVHKDDRAYLEEGELGRLTLREGLVLENVKEIPADLVFIDLPVDGAVFHAN